MNGWDYEAQRADTESSVVEIADGGGVARGTPVRLDLQFVAGEGADRAGFLTAMKAAGYSGAAYRDVEGTAETIEAHVPGVPFDADAIWAEEERATRIALAHGYLPDGWGFEHPGGPPNGRANGHADADGDDCGDGDGDGDGN